MIVLDECNDRQRVIERIARWYSGQIISVVTLRPQTLIKDEAIPMLLRRVVQPTFLTVNVADFWPQTPPHPDYCVIAAALRQEDSLIAADYLRRCLQLPQFRTKANRMGKVILLKSSHFEYFGLDRRIVQLDWPE